MRTANIILAVAVGLAACGPICEPKRTRQGAWGNTTCAPDEGPAGAPLGVEGDELDGGVDGR